jgi:5-methylcytosine-specific restriction endonuclease McrA
MCVDEYIFITKRDSPYIFTEELVCKKYQIEPTTENQDKIKAFIERRVYSYRQRDSEKKERCITFEDAKELDDYLINTLYFDVSNNDDELQKLRYLAGKKVSDLTPDQKTEVSTYITRTLRPVLLYKRAGDTKLLVNEIPDFKTTSYKELCDILLNNPGECSYCKCKITLLNTEYSKSALTFDAIVPLYGHRKDNITISCSLCNSKKSFKNNLDI